MTGAITAGCLTASRAKYGLTVNELNPDGGSGDEVEAIKANKDNKGPQAPDVIDVGFSFGKSSKDESLLMPYKVSTWDSIPAEAKDADGYWYGDYYGVMSFLVNTDVQAKGAAGLGRSAGSCLQGSDCPVGRSPHLQSGHPGSLRLRLWPTAALWITRSQGWTSLPSSTRPATSCR